MRTSSISTAAARLAAACAFVFLTAWTSRAGVEIDVQVTAIRGTSANSTVSAELKSVEADLKKQFKLTGFQQLKRANGKASDTKPFVTDLTDRYKASVTAVERKDNRVTLVLEITKEKPQPDAKEGDKKDKKDGKDEKGGTDKGKDGKDQKKPGCVTKTKLVIDAGKSQFVSVPYPGAPDDLLIIAVSAK
jgi:hypothetical protein